jgi:hypothetical protein
MSEPRSKTKIVFFDGESLGFFHNASDDKPARLNSQRLQAAMDFCKRHGWKGRIYLPQKRFESHHEDNLADDLAIIARLFNLNVLSLICAGTDHKKAMMQAAMKYESIVVSNGDLKEIEKAMNKGRTRNERSSIRVVFHAIKGFSFRGKDLWATF